MSDIGIQSSYRKHSTVELVQLLSHMESAGRREKTVTLDRILNTVNNQHKLLKSGLRAKQNSVYPFRCRSGHQSINQYDQV